MTLHILELIEASLQEVLKRSERISEADDFLTSESGGLGSVIHRMIDDLHPKQSI